MKTITAIIELTRTNLSNLIQLFDEIKETLKMKPDLDEDIVELMNTFPDTADNHMMWLNVCMDHTQEKIEDNTIYKPEERSEIQNSIIDVSEFVKNASTKMQEAISKM